MIKKIVFCLILLCCTSSFAFAENLSDNMNENITNDDIDINDWFIPIVSPTNLDPNSDPDINDWNDWFIPIDDMLLVSPNPEHINDGIDIITPIDNIIYVSPNPEHTHNKTL